jgi:hypothetical protein
VTLVPSGPTCEVAVARAVANGADTAGASKFGAGCFAVTGVVANADAVPQKKARPYYVAGMMPDHDTAAIALEAAEGVPGGWQRNTSTG